MFLSYILHFPPHSLYNRPCRWVLFLVSSGSTSYAPPWGTGYCSSLLKQWLLLQKIKWSLRTYYTQFSPPKCQCFRSFPHLLIYKKASVNFHNFTLIFFSSTHTHVTVLHSLLNIPTLIFLLYKTYTNTHPILCSWE